MTESIGQHPPVSRKDITQVSQEFQPLVTNVLRAERIYPYGQYRTEIHNHPDRFGELNTSPRASLNVGCQLNEQLEPIKIWVDTHSQTFTFRGAEGMYQKPEGHNGFPTHPSFVITQSEIKGKPVYVCNFQNDSPSDPRRGIISFTMIFDEISGRQLVESMQSGFDLPSFIEEAYSAHFPIEVQSQLLWKRKPEHYMPVFILKKSDGEIAPALTRRVSDGSESPINVWIWERPDQKLHYCK